jgi:hypothetical protein
LLIDKVCLCAACSLWPNASARAQFFSDLSI